MNVAHASPATPMGMTIVRTRSSPTFATLDAMRNMRGVRLSPSAENTPVHTLYTKTKRKPPM